MATQERARYGVDAPGVLAGMTAGGLAALAAGGVALAHRWRIPGWLLVAGGLYSLASATSFAYTMLRGRFTVWEAEVDRLGLAETEGVLDLGCGRGAVLALVAQRLPDGRATGIDLWRSQDQSGNTLDAAAGNLRAEGTPPAPSSSPATCEPFPSTTPNSTSPCPAWPSTTSPTRPDATAR